MKKFFGISLALSIFLMMSSVATATDCRQACPCPGTYGWHIGNLWGWQCPDNTPSTPGTPTTPTEPDTDTGTGDTADGNDNTEIGNMADQVAALVNEQRAANGLAPLELDDELCAAAQVRAAEAAVSFSHTRPDGTSCFTALKQAGISYRTAGENIAYGQATPAAVMNDWMNSSGHRANILSSKYSKIGVGYTVVGGVAYWSQFFTD